MNTACNCPPCTCKLQNSPDDYIEIDESTIIVQPSKPKESEPKPEPKGGKPNKTTREFIRERLMDRAAECLEWTKTKVFSSLDNTTWSEESNQLSAKNIIEQWETEVNNRIYWSERLPEGLPTLEGANKDTEQITLEELYAHLAKIMALHPDVAKMSIRHAECHSDVQTFEISFTPKDGYLLFE